ncbi:retrovirus-related pol polyprotein from transposon TNT 1-94 [Tanacetum coccineum]
MSGTIPPPQVLNPRNTGNTNRRGSHVTNVLQLDVKDFTSWKDRFLVYLDGLEPFLLEILENGPFVPKSTASTPENFLPKPQKHHEGPSEIRDTMIAALRLKFNAFKALEGERVKETYTMLKILLNELENKDVKIPQAKNDSLATLFGTYNYEEELIDQIYKSETKRFTIQSSTSKALISNTCSQDSDSDVEEDTKSSGEFLADLNVEFHDRALLANQKRFYKRSGRVGASRKPLDKSNETCFACGKLCHFQKDCPTNKTSSPSYPSSNKSYTKLKFHTNSSSSHQHNQNADNCQKDYRVKYKALKAELALLIKKIDVVSKSKSEKGLVAESFDWDEETLSSKDEGVTKVKAFMDIAEDEPAVGKTNARSSQCKVTLDQLLTKQIPANIVRALGGRGKRKETVSSKEVLFTKGTSTSFTSLSKAEPIGTSNDVIPPADLFQTSTVSDKTKHVTEKESSVKIIKKKAHTKTPSVPDLSPERKADSSTEQLFLTSMKEVKALSQTNSSGSSNSLKALPVNNPTFNVSILQFNKITIHSYYNSLTLIA